MLQLLWRFSQGQFIYVHKRYHPGIIRADFLAVGRLVQEVQRESVRFCILPSSRPSDFDSTGKYVSTSSTAFQLRKLAAWRQHRRLLRMATRILLASTSAT